jgi:hypothetical protein
MAKDWLIMVAAISLPPISRPGVGARPVASRPDAAPNARTTADSWQRRLPQGPAAIPPVFEAFAPITSVAQGQRTFQQRAAAVLHHQAAGGLQDWPVVAKDPLVGRKVPGKGGFPGQAVVLAALGQETAGVNRVLQENRPYSGVGTDFELVPGVGRKGDYDFALQELTPLAYREWSSGKLSGPTKQHLAQVLLNQEGGKHLPPRYLLGLIPETENHQLMTESARYLKNQLVQRYGPAYSSRNLPADSYDNAKNGFNDWFVNHLSQFTRHDFDEYNARPYQAYALKPIQNLYDFAEDPRVKLSAQIVLDYQAARFAVQSSEMRRVVPFRRRLDYAKGDNLFEQDNQSSRFAMLVGATGNLKDAADGSIKLSTGHMVQSALGGYRVPNAVAGLMVDKAANPYFAAVHHHNTEITTAERSFFISAGGHFHQWSKLPFSKQENGIVQPTVVMLPGAGPNLSRMIRFQGRGDGGPANNTGVFENLAFGIRPTLPEGLEAAAKAKGQWLEQGSWTFFAWGDTYVALQRQSQRSPKDYAPSVGMLEIVDKREFPSLQVFQQRVLSLNGSHPMAYYGPNRYTTTRGRTVEFVMAEPLTGLFKHPPKGKDVTQWLVRRVWDGTQERPIDTHMDHWPLMQSYTLKPAADGQGNDYVVRADGTGQVLINDPAKHQSLILSLADQERPIRIEQRGEAVNLAATARHTQQARPGRLELGVELHRPQPVRYLSLPWQPGSRPTSVQVWVRVAGDGRWTLAEHRQTVYSSRDHAFRTDVDVRGTPTVSAVRFVVDGQELKPLGLPEVFQAFVSIPTAASGGVLLR